MVVLVQCLDHQAEPICAVAADTEEAIEATTVVEEAEDHFLEVMVLLNQSKRQTKKKKMKNERQKTILKFN